MITFPRQEFKRTNRVEPQAGGPDASVRHEVDIEVDINDTSTSNSRCAGRAAGKFLEDLRGLKV